MRRALRLTRSSPHSHEPHGLAHARAAQPRNVHALRHLCAAVVAPIPREGAVSDRDQAPAHEPAHAPSLEVEDLERDGSGSVQRESKRDAAVEGIGPGPEAGPPPLTWANA